MIHIPRIPPTVSEQLSMEFDESAAAAQPQPPTTYGYQHARNCPHCVLKNGLSEYECTCQVACLFVNCPRKGPFIDRVIYSGELLEWPEVPTFKIVTAAGVAAYIRSRV